MIEVVNNKDKDFYNYYTKLLEDTIYNSRFRNKNLIEYYKHVVEFKNKKFENLSFCILKERNPVILFSCFLIDGKIPLENPCYLLVDKKYLSVDVENFFYNYFEDFILKKIKGNIHFRDFLDDKVNFFTNYIIKKKIFKTKTIYIGYIDLKNNIEMIKQDFRKSYKSILNKSSNQLNIKIIDSKNININKSYIDQCREVHYRAAKKRTRSKTSWDLMNKMVLNNYSNYFLAFDKKDKFYGYIYITKQNNYSYYGSAAFLKNNLNCNHYLLWVAIDYLKNENIDKFEIGICYDEKVKKKKINDIMKFKRGFTKKYKLILDYDIKN